MRRGHVGVGRSGDGDSYGPSYPGRKYSKTPRTKNEMHLFQKRPRLTSAVVNTTRCSKKKRHERRFVSDIDVCMNDLQKNASFCPEAKVQPDNDRGR